jgi:hypothetical protein
MKRNVSLFGRYVLNIEIFVKNRSFSLTDLMIAGFPFSRSLCRHPGELLLFAREIFKRVKATDIPVLLL